MTDKDLDLQKMQTEQCSSVCMCAYACARARRTNTMGDLYEMEAEVDSAGLTYNVRDLQEMKAQVD